MSTTNLPALRVGEGWDTHALVVGRPLVLGGVTLPHSHGLLGHSDADALLQRLMKKVQPPEKPADRLGCMSAERWQTAVKHLTELGTLAKAPAKVDDLFWNPPQ